MGAIKAERLDRQERENDVEAKSVNVTIRFERKWYFPAVFYSLAVLCHLGLIKAERAADLVVRFGVRTAVDAA